MQSTAKSFVRFAHYAFSAIDSDVGRTIRLLAELLESCYDSNSIMR